ncbi:glycoside hydrolase family 5 protein [Brachybacterium sp. DNPG3]
MSIFSTSLSRRTALAGTASLLALGTVAVSATTAPRAAGATPGIHVSGRKILEADGTELVLRGINHAHAWYPDETTGALAGIKATGANSVRVVLSSGDQWTETTASAVSSIVAACTSNKLIAILEVHDTTGYGDTAYAPNAVSLDAAVDYWEGLVSTLAGTEDRVIINIGNEPLGNDTASQWVSATSSAISRMRQIGYEHAIMVDAPNWGQDWSGTMRDGAASVASADPDGNTIFSVHMYGVYGTGSAVTDYLEAFVSAGLPLVVGEFGDTHSDGDVDEDAIMSEAERLSIGYLGWSWSGNGSGVEYLDIVNDFDASSPSAWGTRLIDGADGLRATSTEASVFSGSGGGNDGGDDDGGDDGSGGSSAATIADFESGTGSWTGDNLYGGPWQSGEWAAAGSSSLKADIIMSGGSQHYVRLTSDRDLSGASTLRATVRRATWGDVGSGLNAKLYVKTGSGWSWADGGAASVSTSRTTLSLSLSGISNLSAVREIGVQFVSSSNSSGQTAIYLDQVETV